MIAPQLIVGPSVGWSNVEALEGFGVCRRPKRDADESARALVAAAAGKAREVHIDRPILEFDAIHQSDAFNGRVRRLDQPERFVLLAGGRLRDDLHEFETSRPFDGDGLGGLTRLE